jgi:hypothetical protein
LLQLWPLQDTQKETVQNNHRNSRYYCCCRKAEPTTFATTSSALSFFLPHLSKSVPYRLDVSQDLPLREKTFSLANFLLPSIPHQQ